MSHIYNHTRRLVGEAPRRGNGYLEPKGADREPAKNFMNGLRSIPAPERKRMPRIGALAKSEAQNCSREPPALSSVCVVSCYFG